jgi:agmatinase
MKSFLDKIKTYLAPPGNGVFTVHTAKENKSKLHEKLYGTSDILAVKEKWENSLNDLKDTKSPILLGLCSDTGGGIQRGANWGPLFIRDELLSIVDCENYFDVGDIKVIPHLLHDKYLQQDLIKKCQDSIYSGDDLPVSALSIAEDFVESLFKFKNDSKLLTLGGDHSISYPVVKEWINFKRSQNIKVAIIHFDAHTDLMHDRLGVDICFASWAYHMIELLEKPSHLLQYGIRSSGKPKSHWENELGVQQFWNYDFKDNGLENVIESTLKYLIEEKIEEVYISFDIDGLDAKYASSTGTPEKDGLEPHQCILLIEEIAKHVKVTGADMVEVAPFVQSTLKDKMVIEPDTTLKSAGLIVNKILEVMK